MGQINEAAEAISTDDRAVEEIGFENDGESANERVVQDGFDDEEDSEQIALPESGALSGQQQQTVVRILPSIGAMVENEIWQYRYPPFFDNIVPSSDDLDVGDNPAFGSARSSFRLNRDTLPSYVIGVLDPAELVEGLFQPIIRRDSPQSNDNKSTKEEDNSTHGKNAELRSIPEGIPTVLLDADDRWVWSKASSRN